ncbi:plasminogen-binding N-terminal domain-containing protein [Arcobacter roscoffensis]|uniref:Plasminogen-binding N-terminal domain-containing protein n=1 Tax=Arcobacter roscoffensis TaxID=2961520 RepID=A0ABY5E3Y1_9BACT|nr:plasminogen-binding N-terminal domain-containing protein [Arcobacter roscoffensis]UTJ05778.1 plasminogen-binding N-terminal domain-containing protein [Arcobacter roscoffensis]
MNRLLNKITIIGSSLLLSATLASAETTVCYKDKWNTPSTIETTKLDGGLCEGKFSVKDMEEKGWRVLDIKIDSNQNSLSYKYLLTNDKLTKKEIKKVDTNENTQKLSYQAFGVKIDNIKDNKTVIDIGNLIVGQSGVVIHLHDRDKRLIVANAKVISSDDTSSTVEFSKFNDIKQDALPTSKREVQKGDILALNYLYTSSMLIAPNQEAFQIVRENFKYNNFLHSDVFAAQLKVNEEALPSKKSIQEFAIKQNLRTIFIVIENKVYVVDVKTFKTLTNYDINYNSSKSELPFYTRIEDIEDAPLDFDFSFDLSILNFLLDEEDKLDEKKSSKTNSYEDYYKNILGIN